MGSVVISIDAELGWGFHDYAEPPMDRVEAGRSGWHHLNSLLDAFDIPATWAVVGHLFLDGCDGIHGDHASIPGWFDMERGAWADRPDLRFAPDLIRAVREADTDHDLGCHTFSHVRFDDPRVTPEIVNAELTAVERLGRSHGIDFTSFVFPRNGVGYRESLADHGYTCYRSNRSTASTQIQRSAAKLRSVLSRDGIPLVEPRLDENGLVDIPPSLYLFGFEGLARTVFETFGTDPIVRQARRGIDRAVRRPEILHLWLHPNNIQTHRDIERLRAIFEYAAERRADSELRIETMADVADRVQGRAETAAIAD